MRCSIAASLLAAALLASCASTSGPTVIGSAASGVLLRDAASMVLLIDSAAAPECKEARRITAEPISSDKPGTTVEHWQVERCGTTKLYRVHFTPTPDIGGTDFAIEAEK
jgi:hypothetical protein